jgi:serine/threonine-protein kinase
MRSSHWERLESTYGEALELPPQERAAFLDRACGGDAEFRGEVDAMLAEAPAHRSLRLEGRLLIDVHSHGGPGDAPRDPNVGRRIGAWRLVRRLGRGGMATVYLAEREDAQFQQHVAIKIGRPSFGEGDAPARFRIERQVLASLVHPHIARLLDGGVTDDGHAYIVMEYVEGLSITDHCSTAAVSLTDRLKLFQVVCLAVQHAHRNLIVHRDLKPGNIMVSSQGEVKLLDFGIAKLLDPRALGVSAVATRGDVRPMTLEYAAPEQIAGGAITTATDVHALGIVLYELLTGWRPFDAPTPTEVERRIAAEVPVSPSVAVRHRARAGALRGITSDLDTIVQMALRKEPERRYGSAGQLADDLERFLQGRPVIAQGDTVGYRARKFVSRHRVAVTAAAVIMMLLAAFGLVSAVQARRLAAERDAADRERARAEQVLAALTEMFRVTDPAVTPASGAVPVADLLRQGEDLARRQFAGQPAVGARLAHALGRIHATRSEYEHARTLFEEALNAQRSLAGDDDALTIEIFHDLAVLVGHMGEKDRAEALLRESLDRHRRRYGERHDKVAQALQDLAELTTDRGVRERLYRDALAMRRAGRAGDDAAVAWAMSQLASHLNGAGKLDEAMALQRDAVAMLQRTVGERHPRHLLALGELAQLLNRANQLDEAEATNRRLLEMQREVFGSQSFQVAESLNSLGVNLATRGEYASAEVLLAESFTVHLAVFGEGHWRTANTARNVGRVFELQRRYGEALEWLTRAASIFERAEGRVTQSSLYIRAQAGLVMLRLDRGAEAERTLRNALTGLEAVAQEAGESRLADARVWLGRVLVEQGQAPQASGFLRPAVGYRDRALGPTHPRAAEAQCELARALAGQGHRDESKALLDACWPIYQKWGLADPVVVRALSRLVQATGGG